LVAIALAHHDALHAHDEFVEAELLAAAVVGAAEGQPRRTRADGEGARTSDAQDAERRRRPHGGGQ
jgi:hypothetical protein